MTLKSPASFCWKLSALFLLGVRRADVKGCASQDELQIVLEQTEEGVLVTHARAM